MGDVKKAATENTIQTINDKVNGSRNIIDEIIGIISTIEDDFLGEGEPKNDCSKEESAESSATLPTISRKVRGSYFTLKEIRDRLDKISERLKL